ncbi:MAG: lysylphosphatidylglycerol synthase domain-containing protein [Myxococcota bacterium]|nr:lysylphosphatidylglycerol synthase domain-containing protein [Myxococcota bacterium]
MTPKQALPQFNKGRTLLMALLVSGLSVVALGIGLSALQPEEAPLDRVRDLLFGAEWTLLILGILAMSLGMIFVAIRWRCLLPDRDGIPPTGLTGMVCSGLLLNYAVPGPAGELASAYLVKKRYDKPATVALAASLHARFIGLGTAGVMAGLVSLFADLPIPPAHNDKIQIAVALIAVGALGVAVLSAFPSILIRLSHLTAGALGRRLPGRLGRASSLLHLGVCRLAEGLGEVGRLGFWPYAQAAMWACLAHLFVFLGIVLACQAMGISPYLPGILLSYCAATAAVVALIAFPGSQLGWDLLLVAFLKFTAGLSPVEAWAVVILVRVQQLLLLLVGAGFLVHYGRRLEIEQPR